MMSFYKVWWSFTITAVKKKVVKIPLISLLLLLLLCLVFIYQLEPTQIGIARNRISGEMWLIDEAGFGLRRPWIKIARVDTRPVRVAVTSAGRGYSGKLVRLDKNHWRKFVQVEGHRYYWWANRFSYNFGHDEQYRGMKDILRGYAYGAREYPFIVVLQEYETK